LSLEPKAKSGIPIGRVPPEEREPTSERCAMMTHPQRISSPDRH
jgi:hypothetical protein